MDQKTAFAAIKKFLGPDAWVEGFLWEDEEEIQVLIDHDSNKDRRGEEWGILVMFDDAQIHVFNRFSGDEESFPHDKTDCFKNKSLVKYISDQFQSLYVI